MSIERTLYGAMCFYRNSYNLLGIAKKIIAIFERNLPGIPITDFYLDESPLPSIEKYLKYDYGKLCKHLENNRFRSLSIAVFPENVPEKDSAYSSFYLSLSESEGRGIKCMILELNFSESIYVENSKNVINFCDELAVDFEIESGHLHDLEDLSDQNQTGPHWFKLKGKTIDPSKLKYSEEFNEEVIDIEKNPCHTHVVGAVDFTSAWTVYLGKEFLEAIPIKNISNLDGEIVKLKDNLIRVTLFKNPFASYVKENIDKLWDFRKRLNIDKIAHQLLDI